MSDEIPHLALPLELAGPRYATVDQDTSSEVACCVEAICLFPKGYRAERPDFGIADPTFATLPLETAEVEADVRAWEPRAQLVLEQEDSVRDPGAVRLTIHVTTAGG
jgi:phage baseplate assembly protein W